MMYGGVSPQECPLYSYQDESMALRMPYSTLYSWFRGSRTKPVIAVSTSKEPLNFLQLSEAFAINYMRKNLGISLPRIREVSLFLRSELDIAYPLINPQIRVGGDVYFKYARKILLNATRRGQIESVDLIGKYINRLEFNNENLPDVLYPWVSGKESKSIRIDPRIRFGQPTIAGTGVTVETVIDLFQAGESLENIATGYQIELTKVKDAVAYASS